MIVPLSLNPIPVYPAGIQGPLSLSNPSDKLPIVVSSSSAPLSGSAIPPGGSLEWPPETPLYAMGPVGAFLSVGLGSNLSATPFINVTVDPTPTPTPTPGTDADTLRVLDQPSINALTAADKATPFVIYNTTTNAINYVVNGAVVVPQAAGVPAVVKMQGSYAGNASGSARPIDVGLTNPDLVMVATNGTSEFAWLHRTDTGLSLTQAARVVSPVTGDAILTATGFATSTNNVLNSNGVTYYWTAWKFNPAPVTGVPDTYFTTVFAPKTPLTLAPSPGTSINITCPANSAVEVQARFFVKATSANGLPRFLVSASSAIQFTSARVDLNGAGTTGNQSLTGNQQLSAASVAAVAEPLSVLLWLTFYNSTASAITVTLQANSDGGNVQAMPGSEVRTRTTSLA